MDGALYFREQEAGTVTVTIKRAGVAVNLTGKTVTFYAHDKTAAMGTNFIDGLGCTVTDAANGVVTLSITTAHTTIASPKRDLEGVWAVKVETTATPTDDQWFGFEPIIVARNPFLAE